ncbi:hypothetical protein ABIB86_000413 [Bradyrhizobium sp. JR1.7]|uniref:hypothetical protein n=1 Tax=unclassified Bradyrhizobium TaxID=2631580 RepID=UPI00339B801F
MQTIKISHAGRIDFWDGFRFAWGVTAFVCIGLLICQIADDYVWQSPFDDSDAAPKRSGLRIKTDNLTGCQYFITVFGGITPRVDGSGKQICRPTA